MIAARPAARGRVFSRLARLEAAATVRYAVSPHEAARRWTIRFERASAVHADLIQRVLDRRNVLPMLCFGEPGKPRPCAGELRFALIYQAPDLLWPDEGLPRMEPLVPDSQAVAALFMEFTAALVEHQVAQRDLYPCWGYGIREMAQHEIQRLRDERAAREAEAETNRATDSGLTGSTEKTPTEAGVREGA